MCYCVSSLELSGDNNNNNNNNNNNKSMSAFEPFVFDVDDYREKSFGVGLGFVLDDE